MSQTVEEMLEDWKKRIGYDPKKPVDENKYKRNLLHEVWTPRWKWVRPLLGWIGFKWFVRWAYHIEKTLFKNVYPIGIPKVEGSSPEELTLSFKATNHTSLAVDLAAEQLKKSMEQRMTEEILEEISREECGNAKVSKSTPK